MAPDLTEHMVLVGSEKYPNEDDDFNLFVKSRGGIFDSYTTEERTCFFFECIEKHFKETLDRFSQLFISPLLKKEAVTCKRQYIDSKFQKEILSNWPRREQIFASLVKDDSFSCGNLKTLKDNIDDDKLYDAVNEFRERHYSAHRMKLAVQSTFSIKDIQDLVLKCFSAIPNNSIPKEEFSSVEPFDIKKFNKIYHIKSVDDYIDLFLKWSLPHLYYKYKTKTLAYLEYIIGDESKGSLLSYLKRRAWATDLCIYSDENSIYTNLVCQITLTEEGYKDLFDVIDAVFSYINLVRKLGPQEYIFEDLKTIKDNSFRFLIEEPAKYTVLHLEESMHRYPPEHFLTGDFIHYEFDRDEIQTATDHLVPDKVNIAVMNKYPPDGLKFSKVEKRFHGKYIDLPITDDLKFKWESIKPYEEFKIPAPNPYLTKDFDLLPEEANQPDYPQKIVATDKYEVWYTQNQTFKLPLASYNLSLISPLFNESPKNSVLTNLLTSFISSTCNEETYSAETAHLFNYIEFNSKGITVTVNGYNEKLPILIDVISDYIVNVRDYVTEKVFLVMKESAVKDLYTSILSPSCLANDISNKIMINNIWTSIEKYNALLDLTYEDLLDYINIYRKQLYVKVLVQGNVTSDVASKTVQSFIDLLQFDSLSEDKYPQTVVTKIPIGQKCVYLESFNKQNSDSVIANYYQVGPYCLRDSVILDLVVLLLEEPAKEQFLDYTVYCTNRELNGVLMFYITVTSQTQKYTTEHVDSSIETFIKQSPKILEDITEKDFQQIKNVYIKTKNCVNLELLQEVYKNWNEIIDNDYMFDRSVREVKKAKEITLDEIRHWWGRHNNFGTQENCRKLSLQVKGHVQEAKDNANEEISNTRVDEFYGKPISLIYLSMNGTNKRYDPDYYIKDIYEFRETLDNFVPRPMRTGP